MPAPPHCYRWHLLRSVNFFIPGRRTFLSIFGLAIPRRLLLGGGGGAVSAHVESGLIREMGKCVGSCPVTTL